MDKSTNIEAILTKIATKLHVIGVEFKRLNDQVASAASKKILVDVTGEIRTKS